MTRTARGDDRETGWSDAQVREFARRFASANRAAWHAYASDVREALIDSFVLLVVLGQDRLDVQVGEVRSLRSRLGVRLAGSCAMPNAIADQCSDAPTRESA
jgi:hypothetical protein